MNYFCFLQIDNLATLLESKLLPNKCYLDFLSYLNVYAIDQKEGTMRNNEKVIFSQKLSN